MQKQSKWLKTFAKKNSIDLNNFAIRTGVSISAARSWIVSGLVPKIIYWDRIAKTLGKSETEVRENFLDQLGKEDRIRSCEICEVTIILWNRNTKICDSKECLRLYDLHRKRTYRKKLRSDTRVKYRTINYLFSSPPKNYASIDKNKHREEIKVATENYLNNGGRIIYLEPGDAEGTDKLTQYLISNGLDNLITEV